MITKPPSTLQLIPHFMNALNTLRLTVILHETKLPRVLSSLCQFGHTINSLISSLRPYLPGCYFTYCPRWLSKTFIVHLEGAFLLFLMFTCIPRRGGNRSCRLVHVGSIRKVMINGSSRVNPFTERVKENHQL